MTTTPKTQTACKVSSCDVSGLNIKGVHMHSASSAQIRLESCTTSGLKHHKRIPYRQFV